MMKEVLVHFGRKTSMISTETIIVQYYLFLKKKLMLILILYKHQNIWNNSPFKLINSNWIINQIDDKQD